MSKLTQPFRPREGKKSLTIDDSPTEINGFRIGDRVRCVQLGDRVGTIERFWRMDSALARVRLDGQKAGGRTMPPTFTTELVSDLRPEDSAGG